MHVLHQRGLWPCRSVAFRDGWGNDELVFDASGVGVPAVSLNRYPFAAYHTHHDNLSLVSAPQLEEVVDLLMAVIGVLERDYIPKPKQRVPVYLTRYGLYADWTYERSQYDINVLVVESMSSGLSVLDIALQHGLDPDAVRDYIDKFLAAGLIEDESVPPQYTRTVRFVPSFAPKGR